VPAIAVANTNITAREMFPYELLAHQYQYRVFYIVVERGHDGDNDHQVPDEVLDQMMSRWQWVDPAFHRRYSDGR
jgi:hypothetical protein